MNEIFKVDNGCLFNKDYTHHPLKKYIEYLLYACHNRN